MSNITCSAQEVIESAESVIEKCRIERRKIDERTIQNAMKKVHFWTRKSFTREEAIEWLDSSSGFWGWRSCYGLNRTDRCVELIVLAKHGNPVTITLEDALVLWCKS